MWSGFCAALIVAVAAMVLAGRGTNGTVVALRLTARVSYGFFWLAYAGGAITVLFGPGMSFIGRRVREFGLAFASAQIVHVGLVIWLAWILPARSPGEAVMPFFGIAIVWTYLLAALSIGWARNLFTPPMVKALRTIGSEYIALTFFADFVLTPKYPLERPSLYVPFWGMLLLGPLLRVTAAIKEMRGVGAPLAG